MAGENFCAESLERRRKDASQVLTGVWREISDAIASAERADLASAMRWLDAAQARITSLRNDLEDIAMERERQMDAEDELCGR